MAYNPAERISAASALKHPWILKAQKGDYNKKELRDTLVNLKKFHAGGKLKQAIQGYMTQNLLSQKELTVLAEQFRQFDANGNGVLSREELLEGFRFTKGIIFNEK